MHPKGDRVLVRVAEEETKTRGGILLPVSALKKPTSGADGPWAAPRHAQPGVHMPGAPMRHGRCTVLLTAWGCMADLHT